MRPDKPYCVCDRGAGETNAVPPQVPFSAELLPEEGHPRRRLADWVTHKENRAFARANANRVWALMFGRPLVTPVDQIPLQATTDKPFRSGLETLADDFITNNYDLSPHYLRDRRHAWAALTAGRCTAHRPR